MQSCLKALALVAALLMALLAAGVRAGGPEDVAPDGWPYPDSPLYNAFKEANLTAVPAALTFASGIDLATLPQELTIFAPSDAAGYAIGDTADGINYEPTGDQIAAALKYCMVEGLLPAAELQDGQELTSLLGPKLTVVKKDGKTLLKDATGQEYEIVATDAGAPGPVIVHTVDGFPLPAPLTEFAAAPAPEDAKRY